MELCVRTCTTRLGGRVRRGVHGAVARVCACSALGLSAVGRP